MGLALPVMRLAHIPDGVAGVDVTLNLMASIVRQYRRTPRIRTLAMEIVQPLPGKNWLAEIGAVFDWVRRNIRYTQDVNGVETLQTPDWTLNLGAGDCDDMTMLLQSLLESIGYPTRFVACGRHAGNYDHVFTQVRLPDSSRLISLDPTEPHPMGWAPQGLGCYKPRDVR